ncbi:hypothetical protein [Microvirga lotononidis]|uniref:hypothetical protein n=1 Tax=Microvirga lotononidis TaxID=864069 RepID=UPI0012B5E8A8|nr:hypothetical protein [Microvirga lotononidis]WQO28882.1 hypothetical protein U0023_07365 [Microvirga lotononidis]
MKLQISAGRRPVRFADPMLLPQSAQKRNGRRGMHVFISKLGAKDWQDVSVTAGLVPVMTSAASL